MVRLTRIYTRGGDQGETSLGDGLRVAKEALRVEAFGTVDEANAALGLARLEAAGEALAMIARIQHDLFDLGADLCTPETGTRAAGALRILASQTARLEREIDALNAALPALDSFVLPGGTRLAAALHLARTIVRRAERIAVAEPLEGSFVLAYLNRLSDLLWAMARWQEGPEHVLSKD
jgi:cob(I)alamin adenosyltransferase